MDKIVHNYYVVFEVVTVGYDIQGGVVSAG